MPLSFGLFLSEMAYDFFSAILMEEYLSDIGKLDTENRARANARAAVLLIKEPEALSYSKFVNSHV